MQIHGGYGMTKDLPLERWCREMRIRRIGEGPNEVQRHVIARDLLGGWVAVGRCAMQGSFGVPQRHILPAGAAPAREGGGAQQPIVRVNLWRVSFEWLLDPVLPTTFFREFYERKPLLIQRQQPAKFQALLTIADIDRYLAASTPCRPDVFLVDAARELKPEDYAFPEPPGRIDLPRAYQLFATGATISLSQLHERWAPLAALCRAVEKTFSSHFQTNIYLSPPNAQGFKTHFDSHDVFVLQVSGSKLWTLYDTGIVLPLRGQAFDPGKHAPGPPTREFTLQAGDLLYCPRGLFHSARSTDEASLHITLGLIGKTWTDVMIEAVSAACLELPAFRANLPIGFANEGFDASRGLHHVPRAGRHVCPRGPAGAHPRANDGRVRDLAPARAAGVSAGGAEIRAWDREQGGATA